LDSDILCKPTGDDFVSGNGNSDDISSITERCVFCKPFGDDLASDAAVVLPPARSRNDTSYLNLSEATSLHNTKVVEFSRIKKDSCDEDEYDDPIDESDDRSGDAMDNNYGGDCYEDVFRGPLP
jgi:hypothetical protein